MTTISRATRPGGQRNGTDGIRHSIKKRRVLPSCSPPLARGLRRRQEDREDMTRQSDDDKVGGARGGHSSLFVTRHR